MTIPDVNTQSERVTTELKKSDNSLLYFLFFSSANPIRGRLGILGITVHEEVLKRIINGSTFESAFNEVLREFVFIPAVRWLKLLLLIPLISLSFMLIATTFGADFTKAEIRLGIMGVILATIIFFAIRLLALSKEMLGRIVTIIVSIGVVLLLYLILERYWIYWSV